MTQSLEATLAAVRTATTLGELTELANQRLRRGQKIDVAEVEELGEHLFHIVADELPGGSEARCVVLMCERRAGELSRAAA